MYLCHPGLSPRRSCNSQRTNRVAVFAPLMNHQQSTVTTVLSICRTISLRPVGNEVGTERTDVFYVGRGEPREESPSNAPPHTKRVTQTSAGVGVGLGLQWPFRTGHQTTAGAEWSGPSDDTRTPGFPSPGPTRSSTPTSEIFGPPSLLPPLV